MDNIETKVADTILQKPYRVQVGEETYTVAPPSIATIILASELIAQLPGLKLDTKQVSLNPCLSLRTVRCLQIL